MSPEECRLLTPLVDVQPVYNIIHVATSKSGTYPHQMRAFTKMKLRQAVKDMRAAVRFIEEHLGEVEDDPD